MGNDYLATTCWRLERYIAGMAAKDAVARLGAADSAPQALVALLPVWVWARPRMDMGRKGSGLVPVRMLYEAEGHGASVAMDGASPVVIAEKSGAAVKWTMCGAGWSSSGSIILKEGSTLPERPVRPSRSPIAPPEEVVAVRGALASRLMGSLISDGESATWELRHSMEEAVRKYLWRAYAKFSAMIDAGERIAVRQPGPDAISAIVEAGAVEQDMLTPTDIDTIVNEIVLGSHDRPSRVSRLLERCAMPRTFERVDPLRYIAVALRCAADQAMQSYVGDFSFGNEIRRIADSLDLPKDREPSSDEIDHVLKCYKEEHPGKSLGALRVIRALRLRSGLIPWSVGHSSVQPDHTDSVISAISIEEIKEILVKRCYAEGGDSLAEVARRWLAATMDGDDLDTSETAKDLLVRQKDVQRLIEDVRRLAGSTLVELGAA